MRQEDDFLQDDLDDEKTIEFIKNYLPQDLKAKFTDDEYYYFLDLIDEYYDYIVKEAKKDGMGEYDPEELLFIVQGEMEYADTLDDAD